MYQWMTHILLPGLFAADNGMVILYNRPVGGLQIRTLRVTADSCSIPGDYNEGLDYPGCYGEYTKDNVDEEPYGMVRFRSDNAQYRWYYDNNVGEALPYTSPHTGITYDKGGFFKNLPYDQNVMESAVAELEANE